jgi:hypothetical protein
MEVPQLICRLSLADRGCIKARNIVQRALDWMTSARGLSGSGHRAPTEELGGSAAIVAETIGAASHAILRE